MVNEPTHIERKNISKEEFSEYLWNKKMELEKQMNVYQKQLIDLPYDWGKIEFKESWNCSKNKEVSKYVTDELNIGKVIYAFGIYWLIRGNIKLLTFHC